MIICPCLLFDLVLFSHRGVALELHFFFSSVGFFAATTRQKRDEIVDVAISKHTLTFTHQKLMSMNRVFLLFVLSFDLIWLNVSNIQNRSENSSAQLITGALTN